jgi:hypothetical protein
MGVERLELVELIEGEVVKLSPQGRDLWEMLELAAEDASEQATPPPEPKTRAVFRRISEELPPEEQGIIERLIELSVGLEGSDIAERQGGTGERQRNRAVILAAGIKNRTAGLRTEPYGTPEEAVARLKEPE